MFDSCCCGAPAAQKEKKSFQMLSKWTSDLLEKAPIHPFPVDVEELPECYQLTAELPGLEKEQLKVQLEEERLTITTHPKEEAEENHHFIRKERNHHTLHRTFDITGVDTAHVRAQYQNGLLTLILPKLNPSQSSVQTVEIHSGSESKKKQND